jgi:FKBP-type peptidyl-prolyl cis-trans isomerase
MRSTTIRSSLIIPALIIALVAASCGGGDDSPPESPSVNVASSQTDLRVGTGAEATAGRRVTVNYTGWLYSASAPENKGQQFDSSVGGTPFMFTLGASEVIRGWDQGVLGMRVGGQRRLVIPPALAYGSAGAGNGRIPPNATLVFDIELLNVS